MADRDIGEAGIDGVGAERFEVADEVGRCRAVDGADSDGADVAIDETSAVSLNPHSRSYVFDGVQMGTVDNDGTDNTTFAAAIAEGIVAPPATNPGPFRTGATYGSAYANFDRQHDAVNPTNAQSSGSRYTVRTNKRMRRSSTFRRGSWTLPRRLYWRAAAKWLRQVQK